MTFLLGFNAFLTGLNMNWLPWSIMLFDLLNVKEGLLELVSENLPISRRLTWVRKSGVDPVSFPGLSSTLAALVLLVSPDGDGGE